MDIALNAHVDCVDGRVGRVENIILNPHTERVTYVVVRGNDLANTERLVPERLIKEASHNRVLLSVKKEKFETMKNFIQEEYIPPDIMLYMAEKTGWHTGTPAAVFVEKEAIPAGGVALHKGAKVLASDGHIGRVDEFLVENKGGRITHLILREGHLWGKKDVAIPVKEIDHYKEGEVYLKIDRARVEALPVVDVRK